MDIGQLETKDWIVIEARDGQSPGFSQIPLLQYWNELKKALTSS